MTVAEIADLPIRELAAPDAHLHIWIVPVVWWEVRQVVEAWGFIATPPRPFVWCKEGGIGMGNIWRGQHEMMLSFVRGNAKYANDKSVRSTLFSPRLGHSEKPDEVRQLIERVSPAPYLELFGRKPVVGWTVWGNQVARTALQITFDHSARGT
jgi:N6-adenosine-specific RNA methylase IME4